MKMSSDKVLPLKCALRFKPPILVLIYKDIHSGKTRKRSMPLREFSADTDVDSYARKLVATPRHAVYVNTIPFSQLQSLLQRVKDAHRDGNDGGPSQTTTPVHTTTSTNNPPPLHQSSLRDMPPLSPIATTPVKTAGSSDGGNSSMSDHVQFDSEYAKLLNLDDDLEATEGMRDIHVNSGVGGTALNGFGENLNKNGGDGLHEEVDDDDDPFLKVLAGKVHSPIRESLTHGAKSDKKGERNRQETDSQTHTTTATATKALTSLSSLKEPPTTNSFSLSSHTTTTKTALRSGKLPPLQKTPLSDMPPLSPTLSPMKSTKKEENDQFKSDIAKLLGLDEELEDNDIEGDETTHKTKTQLGSLSSQGPQTTTTFSLSSHTTTTTSPPHSKETLPPTQKTPLNSIAPPLSHTQQAPTAPAVAVKSGESAANKDVPDYSEDFDSESHEISRAERRLRREDDLLLDDDKSLSFAIEELLDDDDDDSLALSLGDGDNFQLSGSFSDEDFRNIVTPTSPTPPPTAYATDRDTFQQHHTAVVNGVLDDIGEDLNKASDDYVSRRKDEMEVLFAANQVKPGDEGYVYDKEINFDEGPKIETGGWDSDSSISDF